LFYNSIQPGLSSTLLASDLHIGASHHVVDLRDVDVNGLDVGAIAKTVSADASESNAGMITNKVVDAGFHGWQIDALSVLGWQRLSAMPA
jgi:hypothetical protein